MGTTWQNLTSVKKGNVGERLVNEFLIKKGYIPYSPDADGAHPFDRLVASRDKRTIFIADAKTKPARTYYPDTGINIKSYAEYKFIQEKYSIDVFIFFVDEDSKTIYGNFLKRLDEPRKIVHKGKVIEYPMEDKGIRYFPLSVMMPVADIPEVDVLELFGLSQRKKDYQRGAK